MIKGYTVTAHYITAKGFERKASHNFKNCASRASADACAIHFFSRPSRSIYKMDIVENV